MYHFLETFSSFILSVILLNEKQAKSYQWASGAYIMKQQDGNTFSRFSLIRYPTDIEHQISKPLGYFINLIPGIGY